MSDSRRAVFSFVRAIRAALKTDWSGAGFEREVSQTIQKRLGRDSRERVMRSSLRRTCPFRVDGRDADSSARRTLWALPATGGALVATNLLAGSFIEVLRNQAIVGKLGAHVPDRARRQGGHSASPPPARCSGSRNRAR
jgi:hypothetical protein